MWSAGLRQMLYLADPKFPSVLYVLSARGDMIIKLMACIAEIMLSGCVCSLSQSHPAINASEREEGCLSKDGA